MNLWLLTWLFSFPLAAPASAPEAMGLKDLWHNVKNKSPDADKARFQLARAQALVKGSNLLWLPRISYSVQGAPSPTYRCTVPEAWMPSTLPTGMSEQEFRETFCVGTDRDDSITLNLDGYALRFEVKAVLPLYTFGKLDYARAQARAARAAAHAGSELTRQKLWLTVRRSYFARRAYLESRRLSDRARKLLDEAGAKAEEYEENGRISPTDLLRFKLGENEFSQKQLELERLGELTAATLHYLAGRPVEVRESDPWEAVTTRPDPVDRLVARAVERRPELRLLAAARAAAVAQAGLARARMLPDLGLFVRYRLSLSNSDNPTSAYANDPLHGNTLAFGLGIEGNLDFGAQITAVRLARIEQREIEARFAAAKDALTLEITSVRQDVILALDKLVLIEKGQKLARAWLLALSDQEALGVLKPRDMADALSALFKLQFSYWEVRAQLEIAWAQLALALGEPVPG
ncbi:TolC family protein [Myxococcota bacterium]|nr:TolC family protein [Myxococcota bacterium]